MLENRSRHSYSDWGYKSFGIPDFRHVGFSALHSVWIVVSQNPVLRDLPYFDEFCYPFFTPLFLKMTPTILPSLPTIGIPESRLTAGFKFLAPRLFADLSIHPVARAVSPTTPAVNLHTSDVILRPLGNWMQIGALCVTGVDIGAILLVPWARP